MRAAPNWVGRCGTLADEDRTLPENETILVVDDNDMVRKIVCAQVESAGYHVLGADSSASALEMSRACGSIDVVVTDLAMPGGGGVALVEALRHAHPALRALFMSGFRDAPVPGTFIAKPFSQIELLDSVQRLLEDADLPAAIGA
jgi:two-component system cell cycle sensor histidine kinase/response regulator CckA